MSLGGKQLKSHYPSSQATQQGIVLLESLIAILIFSLGILALAGLQTAMIKNTSDAKYRAEAAFVAQQQLGLMWVDPANLNLYQAKGIQDISDLLPNGTREVTLPVIGNGEVKIEVKWQLPGQAAHNYTTYARITGGD
jgi:type IV pilus assembly protein PilV